MATEPVTPITDKHTCIDGACPGCMAIIGRLREALTEITEVCRDGKFYEDHDESCAIIGRCDRALAL